MSEKGKEIILYNDLPDFKQAFGETSFQGFLPMELIFAHTISQRFIRLRTLYHSGMRENVDWGRNPKQKHMIPYVIAKDVEGNFIAYKRSNKGGDDRLHDKWSIGFGGHMSQDDSLEVFNAQENVHHRPDLFEVAMFTAQRELVEELNISLKKIKKLIPIGFLNDDSDSVGRDHFGFVLIAELDIKAKDILFDGDEIDSIMPFSKDEPLVQSEMMILEGWSKFVYPAII